MGKYYGEEMLVMDSGYSEFIQDMIEMDEDFNPDYFSINGVKL